jgi:hypothetical protein
MDKKSPHFIKSLKRFLEKPIFKEIIVSVFIAAFVSSVISYYFNKKIDRAVANREFIFNFSRTFFDNPKYRNISIAIEEAYLDDKVKIFKRNGGQFSDYDIDDYLSLLYDLYAYGEESLVDYSIIDDQFHYYICITYQNKEIREYRKSLIKQGFSKEGAYGFLDDLATRFGINDSCNCKKL